MIARSNQTSLKGSDSARPRLKRTPEPFASASASISGESSTPQTFPPPRSASAAANVPVPHPMSRALRPRRSPSATRSSKSSHHFPSAGRRRSQDPATTPKSGVVRLAPANQLVRVGHRLDRVLRGLERTLRDENL